MIYGIKSFRFNTARDRCNVAKGRGACRRIGDSKSGHDNLFRLDVGGGDDRLIFGDFGADEAGEFIDRQRRNLGAVILQPRFYLGLEQNSIDRRVQSFGDVHRQRTRPKNPTQRAKSKSAIPVASATDGMSGAALARWAVDTASSLTLPPCISGTAAGNPGK